MSRAYKRFLLTSYVTESNYKGSDGKTPHGHCGYLGTHKKLAPFIGQAINIYFQPTELDRHQEHYNVKLTSEVVANLEPSEGGFK